MLMITVNFYIFLAVAMMNDGVVTVYFNHFNEGLIEYIIYSLMLPIILYSSYLHIKSYKKKEVKHDKKVSSRYARLGVGDYQTK